MANLHPDAAIRENLLKSPAVDVAPVKLIGMASTLRAMAYILQVVASKLFPNGAIPVNPQDSATEMLSNLVNCQFGASFDPRSNGTSMSKNMISFEAMCLLLAIAPKVIHKSGSLMWKAAQALLDE